MVLAACWSGVGARPVHWSITMSSLCAAHGQRGGPQFPLSRRRDDRTVLAQDKFETRPGLGLAIAKELIDLRGGRMGRGDDRRRRDIQNLAAANLNADRLQFSRVCVNFPPRFTHFGDKVREHVVD